MDVPSPCVKVCQLDSRDVCIGCFRKREEIARWMQMNDHEKSLMLATLKDRHNPKDSGRLSVAVTPVSGGPENAFQRVT
jgi:predicted Fe-S protein YdhL (DUF1289 family)